MSHFDVFAGLISLYGSDTKVARIISASDTFFNEALLLSPHVLSQRNAYLLAQLSGSAFRFTSPGGSDLHITLDPDYEWISNRGTIRRGAFTILPPGEVATYPKSINGLLVADGAINCNMVSDRDMRLSRTPLRVTIEDSIAVNIECDDPEILHFATSCLDRPNGRRVGELGIGTNHLISEFIAHNSHLNERRPGLHIGFGQHNQKPNLVQYYADIHFDLMTDGGLIELTDKLIDLKRLQIPFDQSEHPALLRDQDVTGDCCSTGCMILAL